MNPVEVLAESNDWGVYAASEIEAKIFGPVDFEPYIGMPAPGDVDGTGTADAAAVQLVIIAALGIVTERDCDLDDNGYVDPIDVQLVINAAPGIS